MMTSWELAEHSPDKMFVNGVCSDTVGLYVDRPPMPPMASEKVSSYEIPSQNGSVVIRSGVYDDITLTVKCFVFDGGYRPQDIYKFLSAAKTLWFSRSDEWYYKVKQVQGIVPQYKQLGKNFLQVNFICEAFRYVKGEVPQSYTGTGCTIFNRGNVDCEPVYKLTFSDWSLAAYFDVNGERLQLNPAAMDTGEAVIDLPRKKIYKVSGSTLTVVQRYTAGRFWAQVLKAGWNTLAWSSGITAVEVTKNERWL